MHEVNNSLISKLAWKVMRNDDSLWIKLLCSKYLKGKDWRSAKEGPHQSWVWRSILKALPLLSWGSCFLVGDGQDIRVWDDPWIPSIPNFKPSPLSAPSESSSMLVKELIDEDTGRWDRCKVRRLCHLDSAEVIFQIKIPVEPRRDELSGCMTSRALFR